MIPLILAILCQRLMYACLTLFLLFGLSLTCTSIAQAGAIYNNPLLSVTSGFGRDRELTSVWRQLHRMPADPSLTQSCKVDDVVVSPCGVTDDVGDAWVLAQYFVHATRNARIAREHGCYELKDRYLRVVKLVQPRPRRFCGKPKSVGIRREISKIHQSPEDRKDSYVALIAARAREGERFGAYSILSSSTPANSLLRSTQRLRLARSHCTFS